MFGAVEGAAEKNLAASWFAPGVAEYWLRKAYMRRRSRDERTVVGVQRTSLEEPALPAAN